MSAIYNPEKGRFEAQADIQSDFVEPQLAEKDRADAEFLCLFGRTSKDPIDFVETCERNVQIQAYDLYQSGLELRSPGVLINIAEYDLPLSILMDVLVEKDLVHGKAWKQYRLMQGFQTRQSLPTGGVLLMDKKLQMRGMAQAEMADRVSAVSERISGAVGELCAMQLGIIPSLQLYCQSRDVRLERLDMDRCGCGQYTPDISARGGVAGLSVWRESGRANAVGWDGGGRPHIGTRVAAVKKR